MKFDVITPTDVSLTYTSMLKNDTLWLILKQISPQPWKTIFFSADYIIKDCNGNKIGEFKREQNRRECLGELIVDAPILYTQLLIYLDPRNQGNKVLEDTILDYLIKYESFERQSWCAFKTRTINESYYYIWSNLDDSSPIGYLNSHGNSYDYIFFLMIPKILGFLRVLASESSCEFEFHEMGNHTLRSHLETKIIEMIRHPDLRNEPSLDIETRV